MRRSFLLLTLILVAGCMKQEPASAPVGEVRRESGSTLPGRAVVLLTEQAADALEGPDFSAVAEQLGIRSAERIFPEAGEFEARHRAAGLHRWYRIRYDEGVSATKAEAGLGSLPGVEAVQTPRRKVQRAGYFNDKYYSYQWALKNDGTLGKAFKKDVDINVEPVWEEFTAGSSEVIVAVIDGGIDLDHADLKGVVLPAGENGSQSFIEGYSATQIVPESHGTHVAGTIGAISNNRIGVAGIAGGKNGQGGVRLMSCAIFASNGDEIDDGDDAAALVWAADHGAVIANNSWGYDFESEADAALGAKDFLQHSSATRTAIDYFIDNAGLDAYGNQTGPMKGGLVIFAAGNEGWSHDAPSEYERVIAVGAIGPDGRMAEYSNYGPWVDILAPGGSDADDDHAEEWILNLATSNEYMYSSGTSMACPHVAGVAALLVSYFGGPGFTNEDLKERLLDGARTSGFSLPAGRTVGGGLLDAYGSFTCKVDPTDPDLAGITVSTDYDGDYRIKSHESLAVEYRIDGNDKKRLGVTFQSNCPGATATCSTSRVRMQVNALEAEPGRYSATIRVGGSVLEVIEFTILDNHAPQIATPLENQVLNAASAAPLSIDLQPYFTDPDGEQLQYTVKFSPSGVASGAVAGNKLTISPQDYGQATVTVTAADARNAKCQASFDIIARNAFLDLDVYPNPVTDYLYVRPATEARTSVALYSRSGAKVRSAEAQAGPFDPIEIEVKGLAPGTYTLQVIFGGKQQTKNIVKY